MKIIPKLVDHDILKPKQIQPIIKNTKPLFTWSVTINLIGISILLLFCCVLYERYILSQEYKESNIQNVQNKLSYINQKLK